MDIPHIVRSLLMLGQALARDGYRCMLTGMFDDASLDLSHELRELRAQAGAVRSTIQACHILGESTMQNVDPAGGGEQRATMHKVCAATVSQA